MNNNLVKYILDLFLRLLEFDKEDCSILTYLKKKLLIYKFKFLSKREIKNLHTVRGIDIHNIANFITTCNSLLSPYLKYENLNAKIFADTYGHLSNLELSYKSKDDDSFSMTIIISYDESLYRMNLNTDVRVKLETTRNINGKLDTVSEEFTLDSLNTKLYFSNIKKDLTELIKNNLEIFLEYVVEEISRRYL